MASQESYLLWLLSDSNLPTGGFVASSGLEAYVAHGFLHLPPLQATTVSSTATSSRATTTPWHDKSREEQRAQATLHFLQQSLGSYARSALPFLAAAHRLTARYLDSTTDEDQDRDDDAASLSSYIAELSHIESTYHSLALNHVLRRASRAQGIALLTLYARSFAASSTMPSKSASDSFEQKRQRRAHKAARLIDEFKRRVRLASVKGEGPYGHLPTCWGSFTAVLGIGLKSAISLHLFLQARSVLSSSVRLNTLGPYLAHGLLLGPVRDSLQRLEAEVGLVAEGQRQSEGRVEQSDSEERQAHWEVKGSGAEQSMDVKRHRERNEAFAWDWVEEGDWYLDEISAFRVLGPELSTKDGKGAAERGRGLRAGVTTWPLGEIVQGRHDALHSRLFNS